MTINRKQLLIIGAAILGAIGVAGAATHTSLKIYRNSAVVQFSFNDGQCVTKDLVVLGSNQIEKSPGNPASVEAGVLATYFEFDNCTGDFISGSGMSGPTGFSMPDLGAASASVSMPLTLFDFDPGSQSYIETPLGTATATIQWTGIGLLETTRANDKITFANGEWLKISSKGMSREASAVGTFILNGEDLIASLSVTASLSDFTTGSHEKSKD